MDPDDRTADDRLELLARVDPAWAVAANRLTANDLSWLIEAHESLERRREQVEAGDTLAILMAMDDCCHRNLPAPAWLVETFRTRLQAFTGCERTRATRDSLDLIFKSRLLRAGQPQRTQLDRDRWALGCRLWRAVRAVASRHSSLNSALTEVLASGTWDVRRRHARQLVTMIDQNQVHLSSGKIRPLARIWSKSCKQVQPEAQLAQIAP
jgi:hypothetical protein